jgi:hypothetical protein
LQHYSSEWIAEARTMTTMIVVEERNQDDMSRKAGCYLYADTRLWLENDLVHRGDGPAVIFPDGVERWYVRGKEMTRDVNMFFFRNKWPVQRGLDTPEKIALFQGEFLNIDPQRPRRDLQAVPAAAVLT